MAHASLTLIMPRARAQESWFLKSVFETVLLQSHTSMHTEQHIYVSARICSWSLSISKTIHLVYFKPQNKIQAYAKFHGLIRHVTQYNNAFIFLPRRFCHIEVRCNDKQNVPSTDFAERVLDASSNVGAKETLQHAPFIPTTCLCSCSGPFWRLLYVNGTKIK